MIYLDAGPETNSPSSITFILEFSSRLKLNELLLTLLFPGINLRTLGSLLLKSTLYVIGISTIYFAFTFSKS